MIKFNNSVVQKEKLQFLICTAYFCTIVAAIVLAIKFVVPLFMPFLIGFFIAFILKPLTCAISKKTSLSRKICGALVVILAYCLLIISVWFVCAKIIGVIKTFASNNQGVFENYIMPTIKNLNSNINTNIKNVFPNFNFIPDEIFEKIASSINQSIVESAKSIIVWIAKIGATIPNFLIGLTFAVISSIYISADYVNIAKSLNDSMPKKIKKWVIKTKSYTTSTIAKYIKAYCILTAFSFATLTTGFFIIGLENPIGMAALIALCDTIPIFGSNLIIVPWIITLILIQNFSLAIKIGIIFLIMSIARGFLEPKVLGKQIGLHPVLTLISAYVGIKLFGFLGIILVPVAAQIGFSIYKNRN